jgi:hypothetical protein
MEQIVEIVSTVGPLISIAGAVASWYWARKRFRWDAGKELGTLRVETLTVVQSAILVTNPTWRRVQFGTYRDVRDAWQLNLREREAMLGKRAQAEMQRLRRALDAFEEQFLRASMGGLAFAERRHADNHEEFHYAWDDPEQQIDEATKLPKKEVNFFDFLDRINKDPHYLSK